MMTLPGIPVALRRPPNPNATEGDLRTWDLSRAAYDTISRYVEIPIAKTAWCTRNNRAARELIEGGQSAEAVIALLQWGFTDPKGRQYFGRTATLSKLIDHWSTMTAMRDEAEAACRHVCDDGTVLYGNPNDPPPLSAVL